MINDGMWHFVTRNADSVKTPLDEKSIDKDSAFQLSGIIFVTRIEPEETQVSTADNKVTLEPSWSENFADRNISSDWKDGIGC